MCQGGPKNPSVAGETGLKRPLLNRDTFLAKPIPPKFVPAKYRNICTCPAAPTRRTSSATYNSCSTPIALMAGATKKGHFHWSKLRKQRLLLYGQNTVWGVAGLGARTWDHGHARLEPYSLDNWPGNWRVASSTLVPAGLTSTIEKGCVFHDATVKKKKIAAIVALAVTVWHLCLMACIAGSTNFCACLQDPECLCSSCMGPGSHIRLGARWAQ